MSPQRGQIALAFTLLLALAASPARLWADGLQEGPGSPSAGRDLFVNKRCIRCHSIWNSGGKKGPNLASVGMGRNLYELCAALWTHWASMNAALERENENRVPLTAPEFRDIVAYLYYLNYNTQPAQAQAGEATFRGKGCIRCHALEPLQAKGPGRAIYEMREFQGPVTLAVAVWNHGPDMFRTMSGRRLQWPEFQEMEVAQLVEFIRSRNGAPPAERMVVPGDPVRGQALFDAKSCALCHGPGSPSRRGPDLGASGNGVSVSALIAGLWNHHPGMSAAFAENGFTYPRISRPEMEDLLAYVYWVKAFGLAGHPDAGRALYSSKLCANCHSPAQGKPAVAPTLFRNETTGSAYALLAAIWNHGPRMDSLLKERRLAWPSLSGQEMRDLIAYLRSAHPGSERLCAPAPISAVPIPPRHWE